MKKKTLVLGCVNWRTIFRGAGGRPRSETGPAGIGFRRTGAACFRHETRESMEMLQNLLPLSRRDPCLGRLNPAGLSPAPGTTVHSNRTHSYAKFCNQALAAFTTVLFLFFSSACSHTQPQLSPLGPREEISSQKEIARALHSSPGDESVWEKHEYEFFIVVMIILGVAAAAAASVAIFYNSNGLRIGVHK